MASAVFPESGFPESSLPAALAPGLRTFTESLVAVCGDNLLTLAVYGGLARGRWRADRSDINLLLILGVASPEHLAPLSPLLRLAGRELGVRALVLAAGELNAAVWAFPVKFLDIRDFHLILRGRDLLSSIAPPRQRVREVAAQTLRNRMMRLRARLIDDFDRPVSLRASLIELARPLAIELLALLRDAGFAVQGEDRTAAVYALAATAFDLDPMVLGRLAELRDTPDAHQGDIAGLVGEVIGVINALLLTIEMSDEGRGV